MHRQLLTLCLLSLPLLAGCATPDDASKRAPPNPTELGTPAPDAHEWMLFDEEHASYTIRSTDLPNATLNVSLERTGNLLEASWRLDQGVVRAARSQHDAATGRTLAIDTDDRHVIPIGWTQWHPHALPWNRTAATVVGIAARWQTVGPEWDLDQRFPCHQDCAVGDGRVVGYTDVRIEGDAAVLPLRVRLSAPGIGETVWERTEHRTVGTGTSPPSDDGGTPPRAALHPCGPVPCGDGPLASGMEHGHDALVAHPVWQQWSAQRGETFLVTAQFSTVVPDGDATPLTSVWTFLAASEGSDIARFVLEQPQVDGALPVLTRFNPTHLPWDPLFSGSSDRDRWPDVDRLFDTWGEHLPPRPGGPLTVSIHNEGAVDNPVPKNQHRISYSYGVEQGLAFAYGSARGQLMTVLRT